MTKRQKEILDFIIEHYRKNGYYPTLMEIAKHFNLSAVSTIHEHLQKLEQEGYIKRTGKGKIGIVKKSPENENSFIFPYYGTISAGKPIAIESQTFEYIDLSDILRCENCYALRVKGNSMIDEFILNDDIIIVENRKEALNGEIVVAVIDGEETTLKKFYNLGNGYIKLVPANPDYEPMIYEADRVEIQGVLKGIVRSFKGLKKGALYDEE
jgi:repressor LexA